MKKKIYVATTALFTVGALAMLAGCGEGKTGQISGKYKEVTAEELASACENYEFDKAFGNVEKDDWAFNLQAEGDMKAKVDLTMSGVMEGMPMNITCKLDSSESFSYLVSLANSEEDVSAYGAGSAKTKAKGNISMSGLNMEIDSDEEWNVYHDDTAVYIDPVKESEIFATKTKISLDDIMDDAEDEIPDISQTPSFPTELEKPEDFKAMIDELVEKGVKISLDQRDGLKMKFTINKDMAETMLAQQGEQEGVQTEIDFKTFEVDIYVALGADGMFEAAGITFDIDMTASINAGAYSMSGKIALEGGYSLKATSSTATLPDGIATDSSYLPFDIDSLLGGMGGMGGIIGSGSKYPV